MPRWRPGTEPCGACLFVQVSGSQCEPLPEKAPPRSARCCGLSWLSGIIFCGRLTHSKALFAPLLWVSPLTVPHTAQTNLGVAYRQIEGLLLKYPKWVMWTQ